MENKKQFWNDLFAGGQTFKPLKEEALDEILGQYVNISGAQPKDVADIGAGTGDVTIALAKRGFNVTALDISSVALEMASTKANEAGAPIKTQEADINSPDFGEDYKESFDLVFIKLAVAFSTNKPEFLKRLHSILRSKGALVIITPVLIDGGEYDDRQKGISVSRAELEAMLKTEFKEVKVVSEQGEPSWPLVTYLCFV